MKKINIIYIIYISIIISFTCISVAYFYPILTNKALLQPDIVNYSGGAKELIDFRKENQEETYWSNSMFSGMPTYQAGAQYPSDILKKIDATLRLNIPKPADYIFLMLAGFFFLGMVWTKNWKLSILGALMFGFSSYFFIIIDAGHNAKAHAIAYFAPLFAGIYLLYKRNFLWGFIATTIFFGLELMANHPQMTYYLFFAIGFFILTQFYLAIKNKQIKSFFIASLIFIFSSVLAIGMNSTRLLATYEYGQESTRGKSELVKKGSEKSDSGLEKDYITNWSYGKLETLNIFIANFMGGSSSDPNFKPKHLETEIQNLSSEQEYNKIIPHLSGSPYWGNQPGTSPAYQGAIVCFLAILGLFFIPNRHKLWIIPSLMISIFLAWGKNFMFLTDFFIDYVPMYNKFRAVSSFMVLPEFLIPLTAMIGLYYYFNNKNIGQNYKRQMLTYVGLGVLGILIVFYILGGTIFPFVNDEELKNLPENILNALKQDRLPLFKSDVLRTFIFCGIALLTLFIYENRKLKQDYVIIILALLSLCDLWNVNKRFLNDSHFIAEKYKQNPFPTEIDENTIAEAEKNQALNRIIGLAPMNKILAEIKKRDTNHYRVFNTSYNPFNETNTSYFHQSIGGYHGVKLRKYQELLDEFFQLEKGKINIEVLNMLNAKYILMGEANDPQVAPNPDANGNAWFVSNIKFAENANQELKILSDLKTKKEAVIRSEFKNKLTNKGNYVADSTAFIKLTNYKPNHLTYKSQSETLQLGIFSEIYYSKGWNAYLNGKKVDYFKANYVLRAMEIPKGNNIVEFKFEPEVIKKGRILTLISFGIFIVISTLGIYFWNKKRKK